MFKSIVGLAMNQLPQEGLRDLDGFSGQKIGLVSALRDRKLRCFLTVLDLRG